MDTFNLTKNDFKYLLTACAVVPIISFMAGFHIATNSVISNFDQPHHENTSAMATSGVKDNIALSTSVTSKAVVLPDDKPFNATKNKESGSTVGEAHYVVQAGLFSDIKNAKNLLKALAKKEINAQITNSLENDMEFFRVIVGSFDSHDKAKASLENIEKIHGIKLYLTEINSLRRSNFLAAL